MRSGRSFPATSGTPESGKSHIQDSVCVLASVARTGPRLWADPRPVRGKPRSTPRGFRLSGRTCVRYSRRETAARAGRRCQSAPCFGHRGLVPSLSCDRWQKPDDGKFQDHSGPTRRILGPKWTLKINFWAQSGPYWTSDSRLPTSPAPICKNTTLERDGHEVVSGNLRFHSG
jgi:hypothetical protein